MRDGALAGGAFDWATPFALAVRAVADRRLRIARRNLARDENRRAGRRTRAAHNQDSCCWRCSHLMAVVSLWTPLTRAAHRGALVLVAEFLFPVAGTGRDRA